MTPEAFTHLTHPRPQEKKTMTPPVVTTAAAVAPAKPAAVPMQITVSPTLPSHWLMILSIMSAVLNAETPLLLQVLPPKAAVGVVGGDVGLAAILAAYQASLPA
jgi:hypothetical protein